MSHCPYSGGDRASHRNRVTIWPTAYGEDIQLSAPWLGRYAFEAPNKRWTNAYDAEARASRMSFMVGNELLPPAAQDQRIWPCQAGNRSTWFDRSHSRDGNRTTWIDEPRQLSAVWNGQFDVEKRESFITRTSDRWSEDYEIENEKARYREPLTPEQVAQADTALVSIDILNHDFPGFGTPENPYLIRWIKNDPVNPLLFPNAKKWTNALILAFAVFMVSVAASGFSQGTGDIKSEFNVGQTLALLITSVYVLGFALGALVLSPLSEVYGRRGLYVWTFAAFVVFSGVTGLSPSVNFILFFRFLSGLAGSFTQAVAPAVIADMFQAQERGFVLSFFTLAGLMGQMLGPIFCGFLDHAYGWRSLPVFILSASLPTWIVLTLTFPETYAPTLLQRRADKMTKITGKAHVVDGMQNPKSLATQLKVGALRPWVILIYEPIVILLSLFLSVVQGTMFLLFAAYPIVFQDVRGWPQGVASLPFLAIALGIVLSLIYVACVDQGRYAKVVEKNNGHAPPEARLPPAMLGSVALPVGLFWFAWTNDPSTFWLISVSAGVFFGFGMVLIYMSLTNYLVDAYLGYAASALAASTVLRSIAGAVFPLFTAQMYDSLGIHWASSVPGFLALIFVPTLICFYKWGYTIRSKTRFGQEAAKIAAMMEGK